MDCNEWNGEGLPPVGTECEVGTGYDDSGWSQCEIIAITNKSIVICADWCPTEKLVSKKCKFRPINPVDPRRAVLEKLYSDAINSASYTGDTVLVDTFKMSKDIDKTLEKLTNLPPF